MIGLLYEFAVLEYSSCVLFLLNDLNLAKSSGFDCIVVEYLDIVASLAVLPEVEEKPFVSVCHQLVVAEHTAELLGMVEADSGIEDIVEMSGPADNHLKLDRPRASWLELQRLIIKLLIA